MSLQNKVVVLLSIVLCLIGAADLCAQEPSPESRSCVIGHFSLSAPEAWKPLTGSDKAATRSEFASSIAPGLGQYNRAGAPEPRMDQFEILQKPTDAQLIGWTLIVPDQIDFLKEIFKKEDTQLENQKNMAGGRIKAGSCRWVKIGGLDVVRVDVEMADGGKSTNLHFWSSKNPGIITTLMLGVGAGRSAETEKEFDSILSSIAVSDEIKK